MAVDFFGLGNSLVENDSGRRQGEADSSIPPVKPIASIPEKQVVEMSRAVTPLSESERAIGRENSISILRQASSSSQAERARPPAGGRGEEMQGGIMAKSSVKIGLGKPLEELMDSDIMELSREDCRQYLQERGMQKLSWNNQQSIQQFLSHRHHTDSQGKDEATGKRESKDGPHHISSPALSEWEQTNKSSPSYPQAVCEPTSRTPQSASLKFFFCIAVLIIKFSLCWRSLGFIIADSCCSVTEGCKWMKSVTMLL